MPLKKLKPPMNKFRSEWKSNTVEPGTSSHDTIKSVEDFLGHEKIKELSKLIDGKRVCLVGPAPNLIGSKMGSIIDSYDVVVRVNQMFEISEKNKIDYGSRSDILMGGFNHKGISQCEKNMDYVLSHKLILGVMPNKGYKPIDIFFNQLNLKGAQNFLLNDHYIYKVFREVGTVTNAGLISIITLCEYDVKELFVTGITFYNMGKFGNIYNEEYFNSAVKTNLPKVKDQQDFGNNYSSTGKGKIHDIHQQISYFSWFFRQNKNKVKLTII